MRLWLVWRSVDYEGSELLGVYSNREAADQRLRSYLDNSTFTGDSHCLEEVTLDCAIQHPTESL